MKKAVLFSAMGALAAWGSVATAQEYGRVISSTPVIQQVAVPRTVCHQQPVAVQQPHAGAGAAIGAIVGGVLGNQIGHGSGRAAATLLGAVGGGMVGHNIEGSGQQIQGVQQCSTHTTYENRTVSYNVTYEYAGKQYNVQMPHDPGPSIPLQVSPVGAQPGYSSDPGYAGAPGTGEPGAPVGVIVGPPAAGTTVYPVYPHYPVYYPRYYAPPVSLSLGFGFHGGHRHHRHWR